jgi:AcrR family transcriptional regulator
LILVMAEDKGQKGPTRKRRAQETRRGIIRAANEAFCANGYTGTTMQAVADRAGVAIQTVYFVFHTKAALLSEVFAAAVLGDRPTRPEQTQWYAQATTGADPTGSLSAFVEGAAGLLERTAALDEVVRTAAATDPEVMEFHRRSEELRAAGYGSFLVSLKQRRFLRRGLNLDEETDAFLGLLGPGMYQSLRRDRGWTHEHYVTWATNALSRILLR